MELVRCIRDTDDRAFIVGKKYWMDTSTRRKDANGTEYAKFYKDEEKKSYAGDIATYNFEVVYRCLKHGVSLTSYVNKNLGFLLKDIVEWCLNNLNYSLAEHLILYIHNNKLDIPENMEKDFVVKHTPFKYYKERGLEEEYMEYMGYSLRYID